MQRYLTLAAMLDQPRSDLAVVARQRRTADLGLRICSENRGDCVRVIDHIIRRLKQIRAAAVLANVRLVGHFPILDAVSFVLIAVPDQLKNQLLPSLIISRMNNGLINLWKKS